MKTSTFTTIVARLAGAAIASPVQLTGRQSSGGTFGSGDNLVGNIFDSSACLVSGIIGGGNPACHGEGNAVVEPSAGSTLSQNYNFTYNSNPDGTLKATITTDSGKSCTYNLRADGKQVKDVIAEAAKQCLAENK